MDLEKLWPYDIETYPNCFTLAVGNMATRKLKVFEISDRRDEREELFEYLRDIFRDKGYMVGFNNVGFDYPVLHYLLTHKKCSVIQLYAKAQSIIENFDDRFGNIISERDTLIRQIDLFKVHHFDNAARMTSLKMLEFNMRMDNIEELPYKPGTVLASEEIDNLKRYNAHDVKATADFLLHSMGHLDFRMELSEKYGRNFINFNDTKIGKDHFVTELEKQNKGCCYRMEGRRRRLNQTKRSEIDLGECVFDYVKFDRPEFKAVLKWFKNQTITETKGVFTDLLESDLGEVAKYAELVKKRQKKPVKPSDKKVEEYREKHPAGWMSEEPLTKGVSYYWNWNVATALNVVVDGLKYVYGVGGIHASVESQVVRAEDGFIIVDQDVASYYPNLAIVNRIYPEHLGEKFCDIYQGLYNERKKYPKSTHANINKMLKLALNGTYGASNDKFSPMYDPKFTMMITINGQLSLCMLAEKLLEIDDLTIIQCNTDGLTYKCRKEDDEKAQAICDQWEVITKLELERADYSMMAIRDVNNYIAVGTDGNVKNKGAYEWKDLDWSKNHSTPIVAMAAEKYLVEGVPVVDTIKGCDDKFDFMARTKVPRSSRLMLSMEDGSEIQIQNICRYYLSKSGGSLTKIMPPKDKGKIVWDCIDPDGNVERVDTRQKMSVRAKREGWKIEEVELPPEERRIGINTGEIVKPCNNINDFKGFDDINYDWYIKEAGKLVSFAMEDEDDEEEQCE